MLWLFCSGIDPVCASVLEIDPTFDLGDFYVTPTVFEHKVLKNKVTGKHPILLSQHLYTKTERLERTTTSLLKFVKSVHRWKD